jgi:hypothetical protein
MLILTKQERLVLVFLCLASLLGLAAHIFFKQKGAGQPWFREIKEYPITRR